MGYGGSGGSASHEDSRFRAAAGGSQRDLTVYALERRDERAGWDEIERFLKRKQARAELRRRVKAGAQRRDLRIVKSTAIIQE